MFAQVDKVPADFLKYLLIAVGAALAGGAAVATIAGPFLKRYREIGPQPLRVQAEAEFVRSKECANKQADVSRRLDQHDAQIQELWTTMRAENQSIRSEMAGWFNDTERALGRIEGKLDSLLTRKVNRE